MKHLPRRMGDALVASSLRPAIAPLGPFTRPGPLRACTVARVRPAFLALFAIVALLMQAGAPSLATAAPVQPPNPTAAVFLTIETAYPAIIAPGATHNGESEIEGVVAGPIDPSAEPTDILRQRPFMLTSESAATFPDQEQLGETYGEDRARRSLDRFLDLRGVGSEQADAVLARFDDPAVIAVVPAPALRAALLMTDGWGAYSATVDSILLGANREGVPFGLVDFGEISAAGAIATLRPGTEGRHQIIVNETYRSESPAALMSVIVHEALHDGASNSLEEELLANIFDTIAWADVVLVDPGAAAATTPLTLLNNIQLFALVNSMGPRGGGHVGISRAPLGDVFVGPGLEDADAPSIRAMLASDEFYMTLPSGGSDGAPTFTALVSNLRGADALGPNPRFDEAALNLLDAAIGTYLTPAKTVTIAKAFGLAVTQSTVEPVTLGDLPVSLGQRPFAPSQPNAFSLRRAVPAVSFSEDESRAWLADLVAGTDASPNLAALFDEPLIVGQIPGPAVRAAILGLHATRWKALVSAAPDQVLAVAMPPGALPSATVGKDTLSIPAPLASEPPAVIAATIVEGLIFDLTDQSSDGAVLAALAGTNAWVDLVTALPDTAKKQTVGTIDLNVRTLALLNSASGSALLSGDVNAIGVLVAASGDDVLPGLAADAKSFAALVQPALADLPLPTLDSPRKSPALSDLSGDLATVLLASDSPLSLALGLPEIDELAGMAVPASSLTAIARALRLRTATD